jgi:HK97 family phage portal protein
MTIAQAVLWPCAYSRIKIGRGGDVELWPINPDRVVETKQQADGRLVFKVLNLDGRDDWVPQGELFRLRSFGLGSEIGADVKKLAREAIGLWLSMEAYDALYFAQGARPGLAVEFPQKLTGPAEQRAEEFLRSISGQGNAHKALLLKNGAKVSQFGFSPKDSQFAEQREAGVNECARWMNLPPHLLGASKTPTYASVKEAAKQLIDYSLSPVARRFESTVDRDLIHDDPEEDALSVEISFDSLLAGHTLERFQAYALGIMNGFMSENEVRGIENLPPIDGLDEPRRSANQDRGGDPEGPRQRPAAPPAREPEDEEARSAPPPLTALIESRPPRRLYLIAQRNAARLVSSELEGVRKIAQRNAGDSEAFGKLAGDFYREHAVRIMEQLELEPSLARAYCSRHAEELATEGASAMERWAQAAPGELAALVIEEEPRHA